ncbi:hypothetical protein ASD11_15285 [Aeromicrobium sp. Root495]|nr:hypothetical protein ASD11_15285 [Aeromicrobium sp. Root495]
MDIGQVKVSNDKAGVVVDFRIPEASEGVYPYGTFRVSLDTSTKHAGAEYTWAGGLPGDSGFSKYNGDARWRWEGSCYKSTREYLDLDGGVFRVRFVPKVGCLYKPKRVRVYVKTVSAGLWDNVGGVFTQWPDEGDFFEQKGVYSPWVGYS